MKRPEAPEPLIQVPGEPFKDETLTAAGSALGSAANEDRLSFRNENAAAISEFQGPRMLIVAGPGTGKSHLFMQRIEAWIGVHGKKPIYVSSFVRKLVRDLRSEVAARDHAVQVTVETLHHLARSLVERNLGSQSLRLGRYIKMIGPEWKDMVWGDVLSLHPDIEELPQLSELEAQFFASELNPEDPWPAIRASHFRLCQFYNAIGFADSILLATEAVQETPELVEHTLWIVDEFQDFNVAEDNLIRACVRQADAVLLAGDDDQALYQALKASHPEIIRGYYADEDWANAMLPFCSRCDYHIAMAATAFLAKTREPASIRKVFLPLQVQPEAQRVRLIMCSSPTVAVNYVENFIEAHRLEIEERRDKILEGVEKDPFLLVLSYAKDVSAYFKEEGERLANMISTWRLEENRPGADYLRMMLYFGVSKRPKDNLGFRKVLELEGVPPAVSHGILATALADGVGLSQVSTVEVARVLATCARVAEVLGSDAEPTEQVARLADVVQVEDQEKLVADLMAYPVADSEDEEEEQIETAGAISPVELLTMVGSKGLSADHVIILGCDDVNMSAASPQVFFVAMTRARRSLHMLAALRARGASMPHDYLSELPPAHVEYGKATKTSEEIFSSRTKFVEYVRNLKKAREKTGAASKKMRSSARKP